MISRIIKKIFTVLAVIITLIFLAISVFSFTLYKKGQNLISQDVKNIENVLKIARNIRGLISY